MPVWIDPQGLDRMTLKQGEFVNPTASWMKDGSVLNDYYEFNFRLQDKYFNTLYNLNYMLNDKSGVRLGAYNPKTRGRYVAH